MPAHSLDGTLTWSLTHWPGSDTTKCHHQISAAEPVGAFSWSETQNGFHIAGMWRGDNAPQLRSRLSLSPDASIAALLCRGWQEWGTDLAENLHGPFAFALLDSRKHTLYLARDGLGVEPLFLARGADRIAVSCCPREARRAAQLSSSPDPAMVADFVRGTVSSAGASFHKGMTRIAPGQWMTIGPDNDAAATYWSPASITPEIDYPDAAERFREIFAHEVGMSGGHDGNLAVLLSGGLDSSAVAAFTANFCERENDAATLSLTYENNPGWVDGPYLAAMREKLAMDHHSLPSGSHDPFADMDDLLIALDGPCFGYGLSVSTSLFTYAKVHSFKTVLHGHGGDEVVSYGLGRLNELASAGQWLMLWREAEGASHLWSQSQWRVFERYMVHRPEWRWLKTKLKRSNMAAAPQTNILAPGLPPQDPPPDGDPRPVQLRPEHTERDVHIAALRNPIQSHALETIMLTGRYHGLRIGMPFVSRELAELTVALPSHWKLRGGYSRYILREAMRPFVPASVANRRGKNDFTQDFVDGFLASTFAREYADPANQALTQYFNSQWLTENWAKVERDGGKVSIETVRGLWRAAVLGRWLMMDRDAGIIGGEQR